MSERDSNPYLAALDRAHCLLCYRTGFRVSPESRALSSGSSHGLLPDGHSPRRPYRGAYAGTAYDPQGWPPLGTDRWSPEESNLRALPPGGTGARLSELSPVQTWSGWSYRKLRPSSSSPVGEDLSESNQGDGHQHDHQDGGHEVHVLLLCGLRLGTRGTGKTSGLRATVRHCSGWFALRLSRPPC